MIKALDLFCGAGGASEGLHRAGFEVTGVDLWSQRKYPFEFIRHNAITFPLEGFDFIWASPPCQKYSVCHRINRGAQADLIPTIRERLQKTKTPWVIENVVGAPLINPITLCGTMFDLPLYKHRLFECSFNITAPKHKKHEIRLAKMGRRPREDEYMHIVGNFIGVDRAREAMDINWMSTKELSKAIPPAYSKYIAECLLRRL